MCLLTGRLVWLCLRFLPDKSAAWQHPSSVQYQNEGYSQMPRRYSIKVPTYLALVVSRKQCRDWQMLVQYSLLFRTFAVVQQCSQPILAHVQIQHPDTRSRARPVLRTTSHNAHHRAAIQSSKGCERTCPSLLPTMNPKARLPYRLRVYSILANPLCLPSTVMNVPVFNFKYVTNIS